MKPQTARRWFVSGRVQGVGYRWFAEERAKTLGLTGWARNLDDGRVEVYAVGRPAQLDTLAAALHKGPPQSLVRGVEQTEAEMQQLSSFDAK